MKPVSGGSPPSERRIRGVMDETTGAFAHEEASMLMLVALFSLKVRKIENVIVIYVMRAMSVRDGENWIIKIIQPK